METIGAKIKKLRLEHKLTQLELAEKVGVSFTTISLYESDSRKPSFKALDRIAKALDVAPSFFLETEESDSDDLKQEQINMAARNMKNLSSQNIQMLNTLIKTMMQSAKKGK